jgi:hypothetical protein
MYFPPGHRLPAKYGLGAAALRYAALGYAVIPLVRGGKRPHPMLGNVGGVHLASKDPEQVKDWWSNDMIANIGVATGSVNRLAVVDLDVKGGSNGLESWLSFLASNAVHPGDHGLSWPDGVPTVSTPSGGAHLWVRMDEVPERPGVLPGVDVKGDGGLVVAPPSMLLTTPISRPGDPRSGAEVPVGYEWTESCPHAAPVAPDWMAGWLAFATPSPRAASDRTTATGAPLDEALDSYLSDGIPAGLRNREMYRVACGLYRRHGTHTSGSQQVMETVREIYRNTDKSDFSWQEVLVCAESARRFVERSKGREDARNAEFLGWLERRHYRS